VARNADTLKPRSSEARPTDAGGCRAAGAAETATGRTCPRVAAEGAGSWGAGPPPPPGGV